MIFHASFLFVGRVPGMRYSKNGVIYEVIVVMLISLVGLEVMKSIRMLGLGKQDTRMTHFFVLTSTVRLESK